MNTDDFYVCHYKRNILQLDLFQVYNLDLNDLPLDRLSEQELSLSSSFFKHIEAFTLLVFFFTYKRGVICICT